MRFDEIEGEEIEAPGEALAAARALKRSGTMGWSDELQGAMESPFPRLQLGPSDFFDPDVATPAAPSYAQARDSARRADDATRQAHPGLSTAVELGTAVLHPVNKLGGAGLAGAVRGGASQGAMQGLGESRADLMDPDVRSFLEAFGDTAKGGAVGGAFGAAGHGLGAGLRWLGRRGPEAVDAVSAPRLDDGAEAAVLEPVSVPEQPMGFGADEKTIPAGYEDVVAQGRAAEVARMGGGGSAWADYQPKTELVPMELSEDPTKMALIRTSPEGGHLDLDDYPVHSFEFTPPGSREPFDVLVEQRNPGEVYIESVKPVRAEDVRELHDEVANSLGPGVMKQLFREIAREFPGTERIVGKRVTGANKGHWMDVKAPEVTMAGTPDFDATQVGQPNFDDYEVPWGSPMWRENLARAVEMEGVPEPYWRTPPEEGVRKLTPYERAVLEAQNPRSAPWEDTDVVYGYPPDEANRIRPLLPEADEFLVDADGPARVSPIFQPPPAKRAGAKGMSFDDGRPDAAALNLPQGGAWLYDAASSNPGALGQWSQPLARAAQRGPEAVAMAHYMLAQRYPQYAEDIARLANDIGAVRQ